MTDPREEPQLVKHVCHPDGECFCIWDPECNPNIKVERLVPESLFLRERERAEAAEAELRRTDDFTVTGDELDRCLARAERAEAALDEIAAYGDQDPDSLAKNAYIVLAECVMSARAVLAARQEGEDDERRT